MGAGHKVSITVSITGAVAPPTPHRHTRDARLTDAARIVIHPRRRAGTGPRFLRGVFRAAGERMRSGDEARGRGEQTGQHRTFRRPPPSPSPLFNIQLFSTAISDYRGFTTYDEKFGRKSEDRGPLSRGVETAEFGAAV